MAVEALILIPVFLGLVLGTIEVTLLFRDKLATESLARAAARVASKEPRFGTDVLPNFGHDGVPSPTASSFALDAARALQAAGSTLPEDTLEEVWIYEADANGLPSSGSFASLTDCPPTSCVAYGWVDPPGATPGSFTYIQGAWDPSTIDACLLDNPSGRTSVGVFVKARHEWITGFFTGTAARITSRAVLTFEPITNQRDEPTSTTPGYFPGCD